MITYEVVAFYISLSFFPTMRLIDYGRAHVCGCDRKLWFARRPRGSRLESASEPVAQFELESGCLTSSAQDGDRPMRARYTQSLCHANAFFCRFCRRDWIERENTHVITNRLEDCVSPFGDHPV